MSESAMPSAAAQSPTPHARLATARERAAWLLVGLIVLSVLLAGLGASVGSTGFDSVLRLADDPLAARIVWDIRLPRSLAGGGTAGPGGRRGAGLVS
jgi:iron complex transport system permease protein